MEHAVDPEADDERVGLRLEVDVARTVLCSLEDDRVDEAHERGVGDAVLDLEVVDLVLVDHLELDDVAESRSRPEGFGGPRQPSELVGDLLAGGHAQGDRLAAGEPQRIDAVDVLRVGDRHAERVALVGVRDRVDLFEDVQRYRAGGNRIDSDRAELDHGEAMLCRDDPCDRLARGKPLVDQHLDHREVLRLLPQDGELGFGDQPGRLEQVDDQLAHELGDRSGSGRALGRPAPVGRHGRLYRHRSRLTS